MGNEYSLLILAGPMKRPTPDETREKIRNALVRVVARNGIGATSVNDVAREAGVSAGTIYLHFKDKTDLLQQVYLTIKTEFHALMTAAAEEPNSEEMIRRMWRDMFNFVSAHPLDFMFIEYAGAAQVLNAEQAQRIAAFQPEIAAMLQRAIDDGTLAPLPVETVTTLLVAPAMHLARMQAVSGKPIDAERRDLTFARVWMAIAATPAPPSTK